MHSPQPAAPTASTVAARRGGRLRPAAPARAWRARGRTPRPSPIAWSAPTCAASIPTASAAAARLSRPRAARPHQCAAGAGAQAGDAGRGLARRPGRLRLRGRHVRHQGGDGDGARVRHRHRLGHGGARISAWRRLTCCRRSRPASSRSCSPMPRPRCRPGAGAKGFLGTNPFAAGAPGGKLGAIPARHVAGGRGARKNPPRRAARRDDPARLRARRGWPPDHRPKAALGGVVLPIGGYKGSGLSMLMDIFGGVISGAAFAGMVADQYKVYRPAAGRRPLLPGPAARPVHAR